MTNTASNCCAHDGSLAPRTLQTRSVIFPVIGTLSIWVGRMHQRRALSRLDARLLKDIGVTPCAQARECAKFFWQV